MENKHKLNAGRPVGSFKYLSPLNHKPVPIHIYKAQMTALRRESLSSKSNNKYIPAYTDNKLKKLIEIRDAVESLIRGQLQSLKILNKPIEKEAE